MSAVDQAIKNLNRNGFLYLPVDKSLNLHEEIIKLKSEISKNLTLFFILGFSSVGVFSAFTYNALAHTQVINASLFNTAIPAMIILVCFMLKIEKTNIC